MTRRQFLAGASAAWVATQFSGAVLWSRPALAQGSAAPAEGERLTGFIVSDAHFGWRDPSQPSPQVIADAMRTILRRFPDLTVFVDTGDAHHNYGDDADRGRWTDIVAGGCGTLPLLYCMGNHEHAGQTDAETRSCQLGSLSCRPYQSWTLGGIHFVAAPQMIEACYVSQELLDWLELDLAVHRDRTTIVLSHNSLKGTTAAGFDVGYRQVVNSRQVLELLQRYPNVIAWMHGHNHTWELAKALDRFFVSNGRIGGFDPGAPGRIGRGHIGGIYFEVGPDRFTVRGYSATKDAFFDELDPSAAFMHQTLAVKTTLDRAAETDVCYGVGRARDGQRVPVYRHHAQGPAGRTEIHLAGLAGSVLNEDAAMSLFTQRVEEGGKKPTTKILPGFNVAPNLGENSGADPTWEFMNPGLRLKAISAPARRVVQVPGGREGRFQYYRCAPGRTLRVRVEALARQAGPRLQLVCRAFDSDGRKLAETRSPWWSLPQEPAAHTQDYPMPRPDEGMNIYRDASSDTQLQFYVEAVLEDLTADVEIRRFELSLADAQGLTRDAALTMGGQTFSLQGELSAGGFGSQERRPATVARDVVELSAGGCGLATWLIRETDLQWQVRNAAAAMNEGWLEIGPMRNTFSPRREIVIAPIGEALARYVHRLRGVGGAPVGAEGDRTLLVELTQVDGTAQVEIVIPDKPARVEGADTWRFTDGRLTVERASVGTIRVEA